MRRLSMNAEENVLAAAALATYDTLFEGMLAGEADPAERVWIELRRSAIRNARELVSAKSANFTNGEAATLDRALRTHGAAIQRMFVLGMAEDAKTGLRERIAEVDALYRKVRPDLQHPPASA